MSAVSALNYRDLLKELYGKFPDLKNSDLEDMVIAIDGEIVHEPLLVEIPEGAELHFFHFIAGG